SAKPSTAFEDTIRQKQAMQQKIKGDAKDLVAELPSERRTILDFAIDAYLVVVQKLMRDRKIYILFTTFIFELVDRSLEMEFYAANFSYSVTAIKNNKFYKFKKFIAFFFFILQLVLIEKPLILINI
ncbi:hypothetical protein ACJX0J_021080, partial [Zea mays]